MLRGTPCDVCALGLAHLCRVELPLRVSETLAEDWQDKRSDNDPSGATWGELYQPPLPLLGRWNDFTFNHLQSKTLPTTDWHTAVYLDYFFFSISSPSTSGSAPLQHPLDGGFTAPLARLYHIAVPASARSQ